MHNPASWLSAVHRSGLLPVLSCWAIITDITAQTNICPCGLWMRACDAAIAAARRHRHISAALRRPRLHQRVTEGVAPHRHV
ncbi:MAG: hypothetical protein ACLRWQ_03550 [Flavonifractor plautii]